MLEECLQSVMSIHKKPPVEDSRQRQILHPLVLTHFAVPTRTFVVSGIMGAHVGYVGLPTIQLSHDYDDGFGLTISQLTMGVFSLSLASHTSCFGARTDEGLWHMTLSISCPALILVWQHDPCILYALMPLPQSARTGPKGWEHRSERDSQSPWRM